MEGRAILGAILFCAFTLYNVSGLKVLKVGIILGTERAKGAITAIDQVNADQTILSGVKIEYVANTSVIHNRFEALDAARWQIENYGVRVIIGPEQSRVAAHLAVYCGGRKVPLISPSATDPLLTSDAEYPFFARTALSDKFQSIVLLHMMKAFNWNRVAIIHSNDEFGRHGTLHFENVAGDNGIDILRKYQITNTLRNINTTLVKMKDDNIKIFILNVQKADAGPIFYAARNAGLLNEGFVWIGTGGVTSSSTLKYGTGALGIKAKSISNLKQESFVAAYGSAVNNVYTYYAADAIYLVANAVDKMKFKNPELHQYLFHQNMSHLSDKWNTVQTDFFENNMKNVSFDGITGVVSLDVNGDRRDGMPGYDIVNLKSSDLFVSVGTWSQMNGISFAAANRIVWPGGIPWNRPPYDSDTLQSRPIKILTYEFEPFFACKCGKCAECNIDKSTARILDHSNTEGLIVDMIAHISNQDYLNDFDFDIYTYRDLFTPVTYASSCKVAEDGESKSCMDNWECVDDGVCSRLWYNVSGKEPIAYSGSQFAKLVGRGDFDIGATDVFMSEDRAKMATFSVPFMTTGVTMVRRRDVLFKKVKPTVDLWLLVRPFSNELWLGIFLAYPCVMIVLSILNENSLMTYEKLHHHNDADDDDFDNTSWVAQILPKKHAIAFTKFYHKSFTVAKWQTIEALFMNEEKSEHPYTRFYLWSWEFCLFLLASAYTASLTNFLVQRVTPEICREFSCMNGLTIGASEGSYQVKIAKDLSKNNAKIVETKGTLGALRMVYEGTADAAIGCSH